MIRRHSYDLPPSPEPVKVPAALRPDPASLPPPEERQRESIGEAATPFEQWSGGFRISGDSVALARYAEEILRRWKGPRRVADLCGGTGYIACRLAAALPACGGMSAELQAEASALAAHNLRQAGAAPRWQAVTADLAAWAGEGIPDALLPGKWDLAVINPPFYVPSRGALSGGDASRQSARAELTLRLDQWVAVCRALIHARGRIAVLYDSRRVAELFAVLTAYDLKPVELLPLVTDVGKPAKRVLLQIRRGRPKSDLTIRPLRRPE